MVDEHAGDGGDDAGPVGADRTRPRSAPPSSPAEFVEAGVVDAEVVRDLVTTGA